MPRFSRFILTIVSLGLLTYSVAVVISAVSFYRASQGAAHADVAALAPSLERLKEVWRDGGELSSVQATLDKKNQEIQAALADARQASDKQLLISRLETISANLSYIAELLRNQRGKGAQAVAELDAKVTELRTKVGAPAAPDKVIQMFFRETGRVFLAALTPAALLLIFFYLFFSERAPERLKELFRGFKSVEVGPTGAKFEFGDGEEAKARTEGAFDEFRRAAKLRYEWWVDKKGIRQKLERVIEGVAAHFAANGKTLPDYRCTIHVPDIVLADTLSQLLDYLPAGAGRGRIFSVRFGLIGKVWRLLKAETLGEVPKASTGAVDKARLVQEWGMTMAEAERAARDRPSFLCVPLLDEKEGGVGMFYMDAKEANAFQITGKADTELHTLVVNECRSRGLTEALAKMKDELSGSAPLIRIYER